MMRLLPWLAIFAGGGIGSILRFGISWLSQRLGVFSFPFATLSANLLSCIVMGIFLSQVAHKYPQDSTVWLFVVVGLCGGLSTFSTFSLENFYLLRDGHFFLFFLNSTISIVLCLVVFWWFLARS